MRQSAKYKVVKDHDGMDEYWGHFFDVKKVGGPKAKVGTPLITVFVPETGDVKKARRTAQDLAQLLNRNLKSRRRFAASRRSHAKLNS